VSSIPFESSKNRRKTASAFGEMVKERLERGTRALVDLRRGWKKLFQLGQDFLQHPLKGELRNG
jgi:hypothetical protein